MKLMIELTSGSWRYITEIHNNNLSYSIYATNAVQNSEENKAKCKQILNNLGLDLRLRSEHDN